MEPSALSERRRIMLIVHGKSAANPLLAEAVDTLRAAGASIDLRVTANAEDASRFAGEAVEQEFDVAVAAGGDGTLNQVVNGILNADPEPRIAAAVLPLGTANDFATSCGLNDRPLVDALRVAVGGAVRSIDVGRLNGQYFLNMSSGGIGAEITVNTPEAMKELMGGAAYSIMAFVTAVQFRPYQAVLSIDGQTREETVLMIAVGNGRQCGGGHQLAPHALIDDGLLDIVICRDFELYQVGMVYQEMTQPEIDENEFVDFYQAESFTIETSEPVQMNLDGEPMRSDRFEFQICKQRLPFILPADSDLLSDR